MAVIVCKMYNIHYTVLGRYRSESCLTITIWDRNYRTDCLGGALFSYTINKGMCRIVNEVSMKLGIHGSIR